MRITWVTGHYPPDVGAASNRCADFTRIWANLGHEVTVIAPPPVYHKETSESNGLWKWEQDGKIRVLRAFKPASDYLFINRAVSEAAYAAMVAASTFRMTRQDVVIASSPPFPAAFAAFFLARLKGARFVFDVRDLYPESAEAVGAIKSDLIIAMLRYLEGWIYRRAYLIAGTSQAYEEHVKKSGGKDVAFEYIPNGVWPPVRNPPKHGGELFRKKVSAGGCFLVVYVGNVGYAHGLDVVLRAAKKTGGNVLFAVVGDGPRRAEIEDLAPDNVVFVSKKPRRDLGEVFAGADLVLATQESDAAFKKVLLRKVLDGWAEGKAVVASAAGETAHVIEESGGGIATSPQDASALAKSILRLKANPSLAREMGRRGRLYVKEHHNTEKLAKKYLQLLIKGPRKRMRLGL
ncbi:Glycosyl transferases group 1 [uncultured archaeon]|nr:Glycosyl transferases group 1 [uncultured archaeon]